MPHNEIISQNILSPQEREQIDTACSSISDVTSLATFLSNQYSITTTFDSDIVRSYTEDSSNLPGNADCLVRPKSEHQCAIIARACFISGIPFTLSAGRSNLTGSATPEEGIIVTTEAMSTPNVAVDIARMTVKAPMGIFLEDLRIQVLTNTKGDLFFPVDPTSRSEATVGGAISCNASGFTPGNKGAMRHWVKSLGIVLPNGSKIEADRGQYISNDGKFVINHEGIQMILPVPRYIRPLVKNAAGPYSAPDGVMDFVDLIVGSEGIFGIMTSCTLALQHRPFGYLDLFFSLPDEDCAIALLEYLRKELPNGLESLSAFEYFGFNCRQYMDHQSDIYFGDDNVAIYVQCPLSSVNNDDATKSWFDILTRNSFGINEDAILILDSESARSKFIAARHSLPANSLRVVQSRGTHTIVTDTVIPPANFSQFLSFTHEILNASKIDYLAFGHLGDCHLHFVLLPTKEQLLLAMKVYDHLISKSAQLGGVYSGEHGTGKQKRHDFALCYGEEGIEHIRRCKAVLDPRFLLNRGNIIENNQ